MFKTTRPRRLARYMVLYQIERLRRGKLDEDQRQRAIATIRYWRSVHGRHAAEIGEQRRRAQRTIAEIIASLHETANTDWEEWA